MSGFIGALIGAAASISTIFVQSHYQAKREKQRMALDAALQDHKLACDIGQKLSRPVVVAPLTAFIHFHLRYFELLEKGNITEETLRSLATERDTLFPQTEK